MGWGLPHTPFYVPDPRDPYDLAETALSHYLWGGATLVGAWAISGVYPGPGLLGTLWNAFLSRQHIGAAYAGTNAFDDTMFALRTYTKPFQPLLRVAGPLGAAYTAMQVGRSLTGDDPTSGVIRDRDWLDEYHHQLSGGDYDWESARAQHSG